jgi:hypothetical protein
MENKLNLPKDHGILYKDDQSPVMNANDHEPLKHVIHFGRCCSCLNPDNTSRAMLSGGLTLIGNAVTMLQANTSIPLPGSSIIKNITGSVSCKCSPKTFTPWENVSEDHFVEGAPAIILESQLTCIYGGVITIVEKEEEGQENASGE